MYKKYFADTKNIFNLKTFNKLDKALKADKLIFFRRIVNGVTYSFRTAYRNGRKGIICRNHDFTSLALIIDSEAFTDYNSLILSIGR